MKGQFKRLRGMHDLLPADMAGWHALESAVQRAMHAYGYGEMRTPVMEKTSLYQRSIGEATDIVEKEMYSFPDRKGEMLSLRPENTAGCVRAVIENGMLQPGSVSRIWYLGPMFRYERPQLGRQRQFHQTGAEVYGIAGPAIEAELILLSARLWRELGIDSAVTLEYNTLGDADDRSRYREKLVSYFSDNQSQLDEDSVRRLQKNPLRILDSKNKDMQALIEAAPKLADSLSDASRAHFEELGELLAASGINAQHNTRLVRGLDYYSHTVFEWTTDKLGAQAAVCAGGRYDGLLEQLGASGVPGVGWAFGIERVIAVPTSASLALAESVRSSLPNLSILHNTAGGSMKSQFRKADKSGAAIALVLGSDELASGEVMVKPLRGGAEQTRVARDQLESCVLSVLA